MESTTAGWTLGWLAEHLGAELRGPADLRVRRAVSTTSDDPEGLCFAGNEAYVRAAVASGVGAILVPLQAPPLPKPCLAVPDPRSAFGVFLRLLDTPLPLEEGVDGEAIVHPTARVHPNACVGPFAYVGPEAVLEADARVYPFAYVGQRCLLRAGCTVLPHAVLVRDVEVGEGSTIHAGAVIGDEGFGFTRTGEAYVKVPQVGAVRIGRGVDIGSNTTIDRATFDETVVGDGSKVDNLVQVAHNCRIGMNSVVVGMVGISGSVTIGDRVTVGGQVGFNQGTRVGDDVTLAARTGVMKDVLQPGVYYGNPARPMTEELRNQALVRKVPELLKRLKELEKRLKELEEGA